MNQSETFTVENTDVAVEESAETLSYTFAPRGAAYRPSVPLVLVVPFVLFPLGLLGLVAYAYSKAANRPEWELILTAVFAGQLLVWLAVGVVETVLMLRWSLRGITTVLRFTHTEVRHGEDRACALEEVRGLRLFTYTAERGEVGRKEACLSLVIGEEGGTHGLFGGFAEEALRTLADDIHRRLSAFRANQGIMSALEPISVVATTEDEAGKLMHTRLPVTGFRLFANFGFMMLMNRWIGTAWCLLMFAGLFGSGRLIAAAGLTSGFLLPHGLVGFMHFALLLGLWGQPAPEPKPEPGDEMKDEVSGEKKV